MDHLSSNDLLVSGTQTPEPHDITPSYVENSRKVIYCILTTLELIVLFNLMCNQKCKIKFIYMEIAMMLLSSFAMLIVLFFPGFSYAFNIPEFYIL